jgi:hypothetical protein
VKLKDAFLGLCIAALLVSEILLFLANEKKNAALVQSRTAQHDAQQARTDLEQLKTATAAQTAENARLRSENQSLSQKLLQLQTQYGQLQNTNLLLARQLGTWQDAAQQQHDQLQQIQAENQAAADRDACIANLRAISAAKTAWALDNNKTIDAVPTARDLLPYLPGGVFPVCPAGGTYSINAVGELPTCSIPGHVLPQQ